MLARFRVRRAAQFLEEGHFFLAMERLVQAWRSGPAAALLEAVVRVAPHAETALGTALRAVDGKVDPALWDEVLAREPFRDLGALADTAHRTSSKDAQTRIARLCALPSDPRRSAAFGRWLVAIPFRATSTQPAWAQMFDSFRALPDPWTLATVERVAATDIPAGATMQKWMRQQLAQLQEDLRGAEKIPPPAGFESVEQALARRFPQAPAPSLPGATSIGAAALPEVGTPTGHPFCGELVSGLRTSQDGHFLSVTLGRLHGQLPIRTCLFDLGEGALPFECLPGAPPLAFGDRQVAVAAPHDEDERAQAIQEPRGVLLLDRHASSREWWDLEDLLPAGAAILAMTFGGSGALYVVTGHRPPDGHHPDQTSLLRLDLETGEAEVEWTGGARSLRAIEVSVDADERFVRVDIQGHQHVIDRDEKRLRNAYRCTLQAMGASFVSPGDGKGLRTRFIDWVLGRVTHTLAPRDPTNLSVIDCRGARVVVQHRRQHTPMKPPQLATLHASSATTYELKDLRRLKGDRDTLAVLDPEAEGALLTTERGEVVATERAARFLPTSDCVLGVGFSSNHALVWGGHRALVLELEDRALGAVEHGLQERNLLHAAALSDDALYVGIGKGGLRRFDRQKKWKSQTLKGHRFPFARLAVSSTGMLASACTDQKCNLWSAAGVRKASLQHLAPVLGVDWHPSGDAVATRSGSILRVWQTKGGPLIREVELHPFEAVASPDDPTKASPEELVRVSGHHAIVWMADGATLVCATAAGLVAVNPSNGATDLLWGNAPVHALASHPGRTLVACATEDGGVWLVNASGEARRICQVRPTGVLAFDREGVRLFIGSTDAVGAYTVVPLTFPEPA